MSKTAKKLLSVVLAVLVLAAGFSTTLGAFKPVLADAVTVLDYTTLITEVTTNNNTNDANGERGLVTYNFGQASNFYVVAPDSFELYDVLGFGTNYAPDLGRSGLRVEDYFFQHKDENRVYSVGADREDIHPYVTYEVKGGTSFTTEYLTYDEGSWAGQGLSDRAEELMYLNILVSSDGVNFIPAKVENTLVDEGAYYRVTAHIANVGANTRYVKIQSNIDPTTVSYHANGEVNYYPQEALFIQKVTFTKGVYDDAGVTKLSFLNKTVTKNGETVGTNAASATGVFLSAPTRDASTGRTTSVELGTGYGITTLDWGDLGAATTVSIEQKDGTFKNQSWYNGGTTKVLGTIAESDRDFFLRVQPGTRFTLSWNNYNGHDDVAKALVGGNKALKDGKEGYDAYAEFENHEDFAIKVYTAANNAGEWTEHRMAPSVYYQHSAMSFSYNFIIPEGHTFVRIVNPISGALGGVMRLDEDGYPIDTTEMTNEEKYANIVTNSAGNDWIRISDISYTAFDASGIEYNVTNNYLSGGDKTAPYVNKYVDGGNGLAAQGYSATPYKANYPVLNTDKERTEEQLPYAVWKVSGDSFFKATVELPYKWKVNHDNMKSANAKEEMHFEISTSVDGVDWTVQSTFGKKANPCDVIYPYSEADAPHNKAFDVETYIPAGVNFVRIRTFCYGAKSTVTFDEDGAYVSESGVVCDNDTFVINSVSYTYEDPNVDAVFYDYKNTEYTSPGTGATMEGALGYKAANFGEETGSVDASFLWLDRWQTQECGIFVDTNGLGDLKTNPSAARARSYITYEVMPGTTFKATVTFTAADHYKKHNLETNENFRFTVYASDNVSSGFEKVNSYAVNSNISIEVTDKRFIKIEFPQENMNTAQSCWGNHCAFLKDVTFVHYAEPAQEGEVTYNYADETTSTGTNREAVSASNFEKYGIYNVVGNGTGLANFEAATRPGICAETYGRCVSYVSGVGNVLKAGAEWGAFEAPYIVYKVKPGTVFTADLYLHTSTPGLATNLNNMKNSVGEEAWGDLPTTFNFTIEASGSEDGGWKNAISTNDATGTNKFKYNVPADCSYVKITFPHRGAIVSGTATSGQTLAVAGNDLARIYGVAYVPFDANVVVSNDYAAKGEVVLDEEVKTAYEIYDFDGVIGTANGLAANADDAYVTYKVSNDQALVINSADKLDIAVSYDGKTFVDAQLTAFAGAYTVNVLEGKQYVKVTLDAGETITAVKAAALAPTATFVNYAGTTDVIELDAYGATPTTTINTSRVGYTFSGWDTEVGALYLDKTYTAQYDKNETNFAITVENGTIVSVAGVECEAETTEATARFDDRVVIEAPATYDGFVFDKWIDKATGKAISNSHKFSFLASAKLDLIADYQESKTEIKPDDYIYTNANAIVTDNDSKWNMSVVWRVNAPAGVEITETGLVIAATETTMEVDAANTVKRAHSSVATNKTLMYTITGIADGATRYARPYAVLADGTTVYGDIVTATDAQ